MEVDFVVIKCGYKKDNFCNCYKTEIDNKTNKCRDCSNKIEIYTEKDKRVLLYKSFSDANKEKNAYDVMYMRGIYGHHSAIEDDFDSIYYSGYTIWLVLHKKYKYLFDRDRDILDVFCNMQFMHMKMPKRLRREAERIKHRCEREQPWWY